MDIIENKGGWSVRVIMNLGEKSDIPTWDE